MPMDTPPFDTRFMDNGDRQILLHAEVLKVLAYDAAESGVAKGVLTLDKIAAVREISNDKALQHADTPQVDAYRKILELAEIHRDLVDDARPLKDHVNDLLSTARGTFYRIQSKEGIADPKEYWDDTVSIVQKSTAERKRNIIEMLQSVAELDGSVNYNSTRDGKISIAEIDESVRIARESIYYGLSGARKRIELFDRVKGLISDYGQNGEIAVADATKIIESQELGRLAPPAKKIIPKIKDQDQGVGI
jgi:hypothetical protein